MTCNNKITESLINSCNPVKGVEPIIYWDYRQNLKFTFVNNTITAIEAAPIGVIEVKKFGVNAGHEVVVLENQNNRFKHKLDTVLNEASDVVDAMDDIVFFVKENGATTWKVYGAKFGCWKESQAQMANDNLNTIAVAFASREGMEEEFECYTTAIDIAALPNMIGKEMISLSIGSGKTTPQKVYLKIDSDKSALIVMPDNSILNSTAGVIDTTWSGNAGSVRLIVPKTTGELSISNASLSKFSDFTGAFKSSIAYSYSDFAMSKVTSYVNNSTIDVLRIYSNGSVSYLSVPKAKVIYASNCPNLPTSNLYKLIDDMYQLYLDGVNLTGGVLSLGGTTKAINTSETSPIHGNSYDPLLAALDSAGVTVTINII